MFSCFKNKHTGIWWSQQSLKGFLWTHDLRIDNLRMSCTMARGGVGWGSQNVESCSYRNIRTRDVMCNMINAVTLLYVIYEGFLSSSTVKNQPVMQEMQETEVQSLGQVDPLEEGMTTYSSILVQRIPWTEEPGRLQSIGSQRVGHDWSNWACTYVM